MKNLSLFVVATVALAACSQPATDASVQELQMRRDSLKNILADVSTQLLEVEDQLARLSEDFSLVQVTTYAVNSTPFEHYFTVQGNIETDKNAQIYPETQGIVTQVLVSEGQSVAQGQVLLTLDTDIIRKNISELETQYNLAKEVFERQERLWQQNVGSEIQYLEAKTNKERLEKTLATLRSQADMGSVRSPFAGVVDKITPKVGEMASPMMPVARVISLDKMYVTADISESYLPVVKEGLTVDVVIPGVDTVRASVARVGRFINPENRSFEISVNLDNKDILRPNMYCALRVYDQQLDSAITLPSSLIQQDTRGNEFVYTLEPSGTNHIVKKHLITTGASAGDRTLILSGVEAGMNVVDKGARRVVEGQEVGLFNQQTAAAQ